MTDVGITAGVTLGQALEFKRAEELSLELRKERARSRKLIEAFKSILEPDVPKTVISRDIEMVHSAFWMRALSIAENAIAEYEARK